jgi:hypothetical protein
MQILTKIFILSPAILLFVVAISQHNIEHASLSIAYSLIIITAKMLGLLDDFNKL